MIEPTNKLRSAAEIAILALLDSEKRPCRDFAGEVYDALFDEGLLELTEDERGELYWLLSSGGHTELDNHYAAKASQNPARIYQIQKLYWSMPGAPPLRGDPMLENAEAEYVQRSHWNFCANIVDLLSQLLPDINNPADRDTAPMTGQPRVSGPAATDNPPANFDAKFFGLKVLAQLVGLEPWAAREVLKWAMARLDGNIRHD